MMDLFLTWTSSSTLTNPQSTSVYRKPTHTNLCVRYNSCAPSALILQRQCYQIPYKTSPHPMLPNTYKKNWTQSTQPPYLQNGHPPDRVKCIMDSVKQKLEKPNKLTLKQFNRQLKATTPSLTESFPFHPTITKKIKKSLASHDIKVTSSSGTTLRDLLTKTKTIPPPHLTPTVTTQPSFTIAEEDWHMPIESSQYFLYYFMSTKSLLTTTLKVFINCMIGSIFIISRITDTCV